MELESGKGGGGVREAKRVGFPASYLHLNQSGSALHSGPLLMASSKQSTPCLAMAIVIEAVARRK